MLLGSGSGKSGVETALPPAKQVDQALRAAELSRPQFGVKHLLHPKLVLSREQSEVWCSAMEVIVADRACERSRISFWLKQLHKLLQKEHVHELRRVAFHTMQRSYLAKSYQATSENTGVCSESVSATYDNIRQECNTTFRNMHPCWASNLGWGILEEHVWV